MGIQEIFNILVKADISPNQFYLLCSLKQNLTTININIHQEMRALESGGWLTDAQLSPKAHTLIQQVDSFFNIQKKKTSLQILGNEFVTNIEKYRNIFPKIKLPSGVYARQDAKNLETAFRWFFKEYTYSWDIVLQATLNYVNEYQRNNYKFMHNSQYFIRKQLVDKTWGSELANRCSIIKNGEDEDDHTSTFSEKVV